MYQATDMAINAMAQETLFALRQKIAKIEGKRPRRRRRRTTAQQFCGIKGSLQDQARYSKQAPHVSTMPWAEAFPARH